MDSRGTDAPKQLRIVDVVQGAAHGDPVVADWNEVGAITSVSPAGDLALAMIKRGHDVGRAPAHLV